MTLYLDGKPWWLDSVSLDQEALEEQSERYEGDPWDDRIREWIEAFESVSIVEILEHCIQKRIDQWTQQDRNRIARSLRSFGWERFHAGTRSSRQWRYRPQKRANGLDPCTR
jgi:predicted P-loop ATPase